MIPADAGTQSAHNSTHMNSNLLIVDSPDDVRVEVDGRLPAVPNNFTSQPDRDLVIFRTLAAGNHFGELTDLCRERLLEAKDARTSLRWIKDRAIVEALRGNFGAAYDLLCSGRYLAEGVEGSLRGRYENEFAVVLVETNRPVLALRHFRLAYDNHLIDGSIHACGEVLNNRAIALKALGRVEEARKAELESAEILSR